MNHLVPQFIVEQFINGHFHGRFHATTLFLDISGFTSLTNAFMQRGPAGGEAMADVMQTVFDPLVQAVYEHQGFITGFAGDAFTAVFTTPDPASAQALHAAESGQLARRALAAALAIQQRVAVLPPFDADDARFHVSVKIGLADGIVEWGIVGEPEFNDTSRFGELSQAYYFRGPAIDRSAAAEQHAAPGEIVLAHDLARALGSLVSTAPLAAEMLRLTAVHTPLPEPAPLFSPPADPAILGTFIPAEVLQQTVRGEYRQVTTLFLNLRDVHTHAQLAPFVQTIFALQKQYGGYLNTVDFGDKGCTLLLFWGMPVSYENDVHRALNFVTALRTATNLVLRVGLTYRLMYAGFVGASLRQEYSCYGRGVNLAARLMTAAPWGQIWVDEPAAYRARQQFQMAPQGAFTLKGFAEPQPAFLFVGSTEEAHPRFVGPLVGRRRELAVLADFARPLQDGRFAGMLLVSGEAGIGKSRLVAECQQRLAEQLPAARWFTCQSDEILRQSLNPFRYLLKRYFQQSAALSSAENWQRFEERFVNLLRQTPDAELQATLIRSRAFLAALVDLHESDSDVAHAPGRTRFDNTLLALHALLQAESRTGPVVLHVEDVHWLDEDSWTVLQQMLHTLAGAPVAILLTGRGATLPPTLPPDALAHLSLHSLDAATLAELAAVHLGHAPSPQLLQLLAGRSDGNPFFAEQMLLYLRAQEAGQPNGASETELLLPLDVRAILVARIDQLRPPVKEVVQMAAVLGREFDARLLTAMLKGQPDVWARIGDAEQATIWTALSHARYLFRHALLRDAAYDMQLHARRRALHALAAAALETMHAADLRPHYAELVYHHGRAEQADPERRYAQLAGEQAAREFANADALRFLSRSLALTPPTDRQTRFDLLREREAVYHVLGQREHQKADLTEMARLAQALDQPQETAVTAIRLARFANVTSDFAASRAAAQLALGFARQTNRPILAADACLELGLARWRQGSYARAAQDVTTGLDLYRRAAHDAGVATARHYLALMAYEQGDYETSRRNYLEVLAIRRAQGDRQGEAATLTNLGAVTLFQADYESAIRYKEAALQLRRETGHRQGEGGLLLNLGVVNRILGQFAAARQLFEQALVISQNVGEQLMESVVYVNFSLLYHQMGEQAAAAEYGRIALANTRRLGNPLFQSSAHTWLGHALLAQQDAAGARQQYDEAIRLRRQIGQHHLVVEPLAGLARVALAAQDVVAAYQLGSTIHEQLDETPLLHGTEEPLRIYLTAYHSFLACSQPHVAAHVLRQAHALLQERAARLSPARRHAYLHAVPHHQQLLDLWQQQHPSP